MCVAMERVTFISVVVLLYLQCVLVLPLHNGKEWVYLIEANTTIGNSLKSDTSSIWTFEGKLLIQSFEGYKIMKLTKVRSASYNGPESKMLSELTHFETENSEQLSEPFVVYYKDFYIDEFKFNPKDPIWSTNIKKAIATVFQYDLSVQNETKHESQSSEKNIHGSCNVQYQMKDDTIFKEIKECNRNGENVELKFGSKFYQRDINRKYVLNNDNIPQAIYSKSSYTLKEHNDDEFKQFVLQSVRFEGKLFHDIETPVNIAECSIQKQPEYEYEVRNNPETSNDTISYLSRELEALQKELKLNFTNITDNTFQTIGNLHQILSTVDLRTLRLLKNEDQFISNIVSSMLPYIGSENSVKFIKELYLQDKFRNITDFLTLSKYPVYAKEVSDDLIEEMSKLVEYDKYLSLLDGKYELSEIDIARVASSSSYIIGFSNFVHRLYSRIENGNDLNERNTTSTLIRNYVSKYCQMYSDPKFHRIQISILLGLGNMGELATDCLLNIAKNDTESRHLRTRAMYAVESTLKSKDGAFTNIWPIIEDAGEPYELRVAALSVLLHSEIEHPESIYQYLKKWSDDATSQHIYHYFYTFMQSRKQLQKSELLNDFHMEPPVSIKGIMTGFYHLRSQDSNFGDNFKSIANFHVIADPITNLVKTIRISLENKQGQKVTSYTVVIKLEGVAFVNPFSYNPTYDYYPPSAIQEILEIVTANKLKANYVNEDEYLEVIVYEENRPLFAIDSTSYYDESKSYLHFFINQLDHYLNNDFVTAEVDRTIVPSDLGTEIAVISRNEKMYHANTNIFYEMIHNFLRTENYSLKAEFKSLDRQKIDLETNNPLLGINHGVTKYSTKQNLFILNTELNLRNYYFKWNNEDLRYENMYEYKHATYLGCVDDTNKLATYCKDCNLFEFYKLPEENKAQTHYKVNIGAKVLNIKSNGCTLNVPFSNLLSRMLNKFWIGNNGLPVLQPILFSIYVYDYVTYASLYDVCTLSIISAPKLDEDIAYWSELRLHFDYSYARLTLSNFRQIDNELIDKYNATLHYARIWYDEEEILGISFAREDSNNTAEIDIVVSYESEQPQSLQKKLFCTEFPEPTIIRFEVNYTNTYDDMDIVFDIVNNFSISEGKRKLLSENEYIIQCEKDKSHMNLSRSYPPTKACYNTCEYMISYDNITADIQFTKYFPNSIFGYILNNVVMTPFEDQNSHTEEKSIIDIALNKLNDFHNKTEMKFDIQQMSISAVQNHPVSLSINNRELQTTLDIPQALQISVLPVERLAEHLKFRVGMESVCVITKTYVKTFTEETIDIPRVHSNFAFIECHEYPRSGLLFEIKQNELEFKLVYHENTLTTNKGVYKYNNETISTNIREYGYPSWIKIDYIGHEDIFVDTKRFTLYYNRDYIAIKLRSNTINKKTCGICHTGLLTATNKYEV